MAVILNSNESQGSQCIIPWAGGAAASSSTESSQTSTSLDVSEGLSPESISVIKTVVVGSITLTIKAAGEAIKLGGQATEYGALINTTVDVLAPGSIKSTEESITDEVIDSSARKCSQVSQYSVNQLNNNESNDSSAKSLSEIHSCCML